MTDRWEPPLPAMPAPPPERAWQRLPAPPGYETQWRRLVDAALEVGMGPDALAEEGMDPVADARGWKPATVALYSKVARYGGIAPPLGGAPGPHPQTLARTGERRAGEEWRYRWVAYHFKKKTPTH